MTSEGEGVAHLNYNSEDVPSITSPTPPTHTNGFKSEHTDEEAVQNGTNRHVVENDGRKRNADDEHSVSSSSKRRKVEGMPRSGLSSRVVSPPWQFGTVEAATIHVNGKRRSARVGPLSPAVQPEPPVEEKRPRRESNSKPKSYAHMHNGTAERKTSKAPPQHKRVSSSDNKPVPSSGFKKPSKPAKPTKRIEPPASPKTPKRSRTNGMVMAPLNRGPTSSLPKKGHERKSSRQSLPSKDIVDSNVTAPEGTGPSPGRFQRLRLRVREPTLGRSHPGHWPTQKRFGSLQAWLDQDNPLEGEDDVAISDAHYQKEVASRIRITNAMKPGGLLTEGRCARFLEGDRREPPPRYDLWSHLCAHAINFHGLMSKEKERHKRWAKQLAAACQIALASEDRWSRVREQKSLEEVYMEERGYQITRYRQLVKDLGGAWEAARLEVNKIRFEKWEREQEALGQKALDEMLDHSTQLLNQHRMRDGSEYPSEVRSSLGPTGSETGTGAEDSGSDRSGDDTSSAGESENMSESSEEDDDEVNAADEDANLSPEALKRKYAAALEQDIGSDDSVSEDDEMIIDNEHSGTGSDETAESDQGEDEAEGGSLLSLLLPRRKQNPDMMGSEPPSSELKVDSAGVAEDVDAISVSGSDRPPQELDEVDDILLDHSSDESTDMDDDDESDDDDSGSEASEDAESEEEPGLSGFFAKPKEKLKDESQSNVPEHNDAAMEDIETEISGDADDVEELNREDIKSNSQTEVELMRHDRSQPSTPRTPHTPLDRSKTEVPSLLLRGSLREYQHDGLDWLASLYQGNRNGILADEMGLGKTIQTISLLAHLAVHHKIWGPHLVVVPTSVMLNWEMEFKKWLPGFKILTYYGDIEERKKKRQGWLNDDKWNVCIASYQLILKDAQAFKKRSWHYLILDEAHYIKNFQSQKWQTLLTFKTHSRLLLTGTPLQNDLQELWSLLYFLMPAGLDGSGGFADLEKFLNSMKRPADQILNQGQQKLDAEAQARVYKLHEVLRPFLLRRLKSEVEKQMPGKYEHVVYCRLSKRQRQLYDEFMSRSDTKRTLSSGNYMSIMNCLMSLRKVCNHPDLFETRQIVTSYAMPRSAVANFEIKELFVRRRLLKQEEDSINMEYFGLTPTIFEKHSRLHQFRRYYLRAIEPLQSLVEKQTRRLQPSSGSGFGTVKQTLGHIAEAAQQSALDKLKSCVEHAKRTTEQWPIYGTDFVHLMTLPNRYFPPRPTLKTMQKDIKDGGRDMGNWVVEDNCKLIQNLMPSLDAVAARFETEFSKFACLTPAVVAEDLKEHALTARGMELVRQAQQLTPFNDPYHEARIRASIAFPDKRLLQYDCGKLQALATLLRDLQAGGHRCLIFTQMTKVLDILEQFLNIHGHRYLRLDGATKIEQRQILTDRFNNDKRILAFILSSRSGGLGINLTGADTVIFYDLDWNPAMDAQCQDRCHRIGQTRDVHIYRFVSEYTIEANILRKSNQKRLLDDVIIQKGEFTTNTFNRVTYKDAFEDAGEPDADASAAMDKVLGEVTGLGDVLNSVEDTEDAAAAKEAQKEAMFTAGEDQGDFEDTTDTSTKTGVDELAKAAREMQEEVKGAVDDWMVKYLHEYDMLGVPVILPRAILNAKKNAAKKGKDYKRRR